MLKSAIPASSCQLDELNRKKSLQQRRKRKPLDDFYSYTRRNASWKVCFFKAKETDKLLQLERETKQDWNKPGQALQGLWQGYQPVQNS